MSDREVTKHWLGLNLRDEFNFFFSKVKCLAGSLCDVSYGQTGFPSIRNFTDDHSIFGGHRHPSPSYLAKISGGYRPLIPFSQRRVSPSRQL